VQITHDSRQHEEAHVDICNSKSEFDANQNGQTIAKNQTSRRIVIPKKQQRKFPRYYLQPTRENAFQTYTNLHAGSTWQAERTPKNTITMRPERTATRRAIRKSADHMIKGPSKEHKRANVKFCGIVIPKKTAKKFPKYRFQPTLKSAFQHGKIEELVEKASSTKRFL
jgi:hypothetical protein